ncbi:unnamed protein product [Closterium sp. NIES-64]|nr:unnamed protein product [Closterium sp. NIES-64]
MSSAPSSIGFGAATRRARGANPSPGGGGVPLPLSSRRFLEIHLSASDCVGAYCGGVTTSHLAGRFTTIDGEPTFPPGAFIDGGAGNGTADDVAIEDWFCEVAALGVGKAPRLVGQKQRQRLMREWFDDAPHKLMHRHVRMLMELCEGGDLFI